MRQYYVVGSTKKRDMELGVVTASSLQEAREKAMEQYQETMKEGESLYIFPFESPLEFDGKRVIFPQEGEMSAISKLE